jgi:hypothetical protein
LLPVTCNKGFIRFGGEHKIFGGGKDRKEKRMKLFDLKDDELAFLKQGLALNAPVTRGFNSVYGNCVHCESVCASGCGANCKGIGSSNP